MAVSLRDARTHAKDREWIESVYRDYLDDLRVRRTGVFPALGALGLAEPNEVRRWVTDRDAELLTILDEMRPAGFAMILRDNGSAPVDYRMAEFFIVRTQRRRGIGRSAARLILDRFAGRWEVTEDAGNPQAIAFWRSVLAAYTRGSYRERAGNGEVRQYFSSAASNQR